MSQAGLIDIEAGVPTIPTSFTTDSGSAVPVVNVLEILGGIGITTSGSGNTVTVTSTGGAFSITSLTTASTPYTVLSSDAYLSCDVSGGVLSILMPNAPSTGKVFRMKDSGGDSGTNNITVTTVGGAVTIDGATTFVMNTSLQGANFIFNGTSYEVF